MGLLFKMFRIKIIFDVHELVHEDLKQKKLLIHPYILGFSYKFFEKSDCKNFHLILAEKSYKPWYDGRTSHFCIIQNFPRLDIFIPWQLTSRNGGDLLFIGNLTGKRGLVQTVKALALLKNQNIRIDLHCIGQNDREAKKMLREIPEFKDVAGQILFYGYLHIEEAVKISRRCFAGIALPEPLPNHFESWPSKMFEYMALGLPVIASDFPLYKYVLENCCGIVVDPSNISQIASAINWLLNNPEEARNMSVNAVQKVSLNYNWASQEPILLNFYKEVLNENNYCQPL